MPAVQNKNASRDREAQFATGILYHNGNACQVKKLGAKERKVKIRSLKTCGTPQASAPPA
jgi:hypothetical protein